MKILLLAVLLLSLHQSMAQVSEPFRDLRTFVRTQAPEGVTADSTPYLDMLNAKGIHYLLPLYTAFVKEQKHFPKDTTVFYEMLAQALSFLGDHKTVLEYEKLSYEKIPDSSRAEIGRLTDFAKETSYFDARQYILGRTKRTRVVMINEAHDKPQTRVFTASLLQDLYQQGFRYLAMEMLDNRSRVPVKKVNAFSGYYTAEPIAAELIRKALEIGYTLVPYEDTVAGHSVNQREYAQAQNLYEFLSKKDSTAKILVHAGYSHIEEGSRGDDRIPMAAYFKIISHIDPLTIDQTEMIENSNNPFGALVYDSWIKKKPLISPAVAVQGTEAVDPFNLNLYDIHVIHPPTKYLNERAAWSAMDGWRNEIPVTPAYRSVFLVQAYYEKEYSENNAGQFIPADQTYLSAANGIYYLYLHKGKYKIVFRDKLYAVLGSKDIIVN